MVHYHYAQPRGYLRTFIRARAKAICRLPGFTVSDVEDIGQQLWLHILKREEQFDIDLAAFETYANRVVENELRSILRHRNAQKRNPGREDFSLNGVFEDGDGEQTSMHETVASGSAPVPHRNDLADDIETLMAQLGEFERTVAIALRDGQPKRRIAQMLGVSRRQIANAIRRIRKIAEGLKLNEYFGDD